MIKLLINPIVHAAHAAAMESISVPGVAAPKLNHVFFLTRTVIANCTYHGVVHRQKPLKIIMLKMKDVCDHMLKWRRLGMKDLAYDLKHGVSPCWRGQSTNEWTWEGASIDPASRVWPKPENCVKLNESEVYASNLTDAKIKQVLNLSGWANLDGPSRDPHAVPDYDRIATWQDIDAVDDTWFYLAGCDVFKENLCGAWNTCQYHSFMDFY